MQRQNGTESKKVRSKLAWNILFIVLAVATVWGISSQIKDFSFSEFVDYLKEANKGYIALAICHMLLYVLAEGLALCVICRGLGNCTKFRNGFCYSAADIYFSAITPSATGGQPACAYLMVKDGISPMVTTVALVANLVMYTFSIIAIGIMTFVVRPGLFLHFDTPSQILIAVGCVMQLGLGAFLLLVLRHARMVHSICRSVLHFLAKLHLLRNEERKQEKLARHMEEYRKCSDALVGRGRMLVGVFLCNFLQRALQITVTVYAYLAVGGEWGNAIDIWATQSFTVLGSNCMPIPGAMGVSDFILMDGLRSFMSTVQSAQLDLLSRSLSFYSCIIVCGITVLIKYICQRSGEDLPK